MQGKLRMGQMHTGTQQRATAEIHTAAKSTQRQQLRAHRDSSWKHTETAAESTQRQQRRAHRDSSWEHTAAESTQQRATAAHRSSPAACAKQARRKRREALPPSLLTPLRMSLSLSTLPMMAASSVAPTLEPRSTMCANLGNATHSAASSTDDFLISIRYHVAQHWWLFNQQ